MSLEPQEDADYVRDITPDVMGLLQKSHFFERLDEHFCPADEAERKVQCAGHSFKVSREILEELGMGADDTEDVIDVLRSQGACCDCEVLYNVAEQSRLKTRYWKAQYARRTQTNGSEPFGS
jgi:hypothetical protein